MKTLLGAGALSVCPQLKDVTVQKFLEYIKYDHISTIEGVR